MDRHDYVGRLNVWGTWIWYTEWIGTWICETLDRIGMIMWRAWTHDTEWIDTWICGAHDYVIHWANRHDYVRHLNVRGTERICMIMWDTERIGMIMRDAWARQKNSYIDTWRTCPILSMRWRWSGTPDHQNAKPIIWNPARNTITWTPIQKEPSNRIYLIDPILWPSISIIWKTILSSTLF